MGKERSRTIIATLYSQAGTGYCYHFRRPRTNRPFLLRKYDPVVKQHVMFSETRPKIPEEFIQNFKEETIKKREQFKAESSELAKTMKMTILPPFFYRNTSANDQ